MEVKRKLEYKERLKEGRVQRKEKERKNTTEGKGKVEYIERKRKGTIQRKEKGR